jgi:hypothetical protein
MPTRYLDLDDPLGFNKPISRSYIQFLIFGSVATAILLFSGYINATQREDLVVQNEDWTVITSSRARLRSIVGDEVRHMMARAVGVFTLLVVFCLLVRGILRTRTS